MLVRLTFFDDHLDADVRSGSNTHSRRDGFGRRRRKGNAHQGILEFEAEPATTEGVRRRSMRANQDDEDAQVPFYGVWRDCLHGGSCPLLSQRTGTVGRVPEAGPAAAR